MTETAASPPAAEVAFGDGIVSALGARMREVGLEGRAFVVTHPEIAALHGGTVLEALDNAGYAPEVAAIQVGESSKSLSTAGELYAWLADGRAERRDTIVALGGGVVGDLAGFIAATYLRGLRWVQVPTTVLAQVDSSVGGKVGVNLALGKNLIGAFHQPAVVLVDPLLLATLPRREFRSGLYEVVKYGMIASRSLFDRVASDTKAIFAREEAVLVPAIVESCRIKADIVTRDERESDLRRVLNYGHTVGHALEAVTKYRRFRHGEAIGYGMLAAADLAVARGALADTERQALAQLITLLGPLPPIADLPIGDVLDAVRRDKKVVHGRLHFVIAIQIGATMTVDDVTEDELRAVLVRLGLKG